MVQLTVTNSTRSRVNEWGALAWSLRRALDVPLTDALAYMLSAAVLAGRGDAREQRVAVGDPLSIPADFHTAE